MPRTDNTLEVLNKLADSKAKEQQKKDKKLAGFLEKLELIREESKKLFNKEDFIIINERDKLLEYIEKSNQNGYISIDTETTGVDFYKDTVVGVCLYVDGEKACYCPYGHVDYQTGERVPNQLNRETIIEALKKINAKIIMHNADFDIRMVLHTFGVRLHCWWDTMIGGYILNENESHGLKPLYEKYVSKKTEKSFSEIFDKIGFQYVPIELGYMYAAHDALITRGLQQFQANYLNENHPRPDYRAINYVFRNIEMSVLDATINMEETGVYLDMPYSESLVPKYEEKLSKALEICYQELDKYKEKILTNEKLSNPVNLSSPKQLGIVLYDVMGLNQVDGKKTGVEILKQLNTPFTKALLEYRGALKLLNTYVKKLPEVRQADEKIHCRFNAVGTACITKDSLLVTDKGYIPIGELFDGNEKEGTFAETDISIINKDLEYEKASHRIKYSNVPTIKITTVGGFTIEGTHNHPIIASKFSKVEYHNSSPQKRKKLRMDSFDFIRLDNLSVGQYVKIPFGYNKFPIVYTKFNLNIHSLRTHRNDTIKVPEYVNEELAELLGMYHADGSWKISNGSFKIRISNRDEEIRDRIVYLAKKLFNLDCSISKDRRTGVYDTCFGSKALIEMIKFLPKGARNKKIPKFICQSPKSVILAYIKGMTLDSTIGLSKKQIILSVYNKADAIFIQSVLMNMGIFSAISTNNGNSTHLNDHLGDFVGKYVGNSLSITKADAYEFKNMVGIAQSRKDILVTSDWGGFKSKNTHIVYDSCICLQIKKIEYGHNDVYDLHVPNTHSFVANSIIQHNTGRYSSSDPRLQNCELGSINSVNSGEL